MKMKSTLLFLLFISVWSTMSAQIRPGWCIQDAVVSTSGGQSELYFCEGDGVPDQARFKVSPFAQPFAYLVTDENNIILRVSRNNTINFEGLGGGRLRVWAFAYLGNILAEPGQDATTAVLADICYGLTQNFIPVGGIVPDGGTVATTDGRTSLFTCPDDGNSDVITFTNTSPDPFYSYVITDENNIILAFATGNSFDFENISAEKVRVWGVSYIGRINAQIGDDLSTIAFASGCFDLSDNFVEITRANPDGGTVSLTSGETTKTICAENLAGDVVRFVSETTADNPYAFIVTDENGVVIAVLDGNTADFSLSEPGICRIYGVSYTGELKVGEGDDISSAILSDDCFDLSDNFVTIIKREVDGGTVSLAGGGNNATVCVEGGASEALSFVHTTSVDDANYVFIVTDQNNVIQAVVDGSSINFANVSARNLRVWGLSYTGTLLAKPGDNAATSALASECYDLSDNFISILRKSVDGGTISLENGGEAITACVGDGRPDIFGFSNNSTSVESYIYIVTTLDGRVIGFINGDQFNFETLSVPEARIYGLSYSGAFTVQLGDNINRVNLSSECADLSDNFVTVTGKFIDGGTVSLEDGSTKAKLCSGDGSSSVLNFVTNSNTGDNYAFVITNVNNDIIAFANGNSYDFAGNINATFRVWGLSYSGTVLAQPGDNAARIQLTDECFELSDNFITVTRSVVDGAAISLENGATEAVLCLGTAQSNRFVFANTSLFGNYAYLLTNEQNIVIETTLANAFDLAGFSAGVYRVWGVSYIGNLTVRPGDDAAAVALADDCFDLSDNFVTINTDEVEGGIVSLAGGGDGATVCIGDFNPDELSFATNETTGDYVFLVTNEENTILAITSGNSFNFNDVDAAVLRVWGLAYSGDLTAQIGDNAATVDLSDACYDLSDNFLTIVRQIVDGGTVSLENGDTLLVACAGVDGAPFSTFVNTSTAGGNYAYLITNEQNTVQAVSESNSFTFADFPQGIYRVWGVSYTGNLAVQAGDDASATPLSDECYDLSGNFVTIIQKDVDGGTVSLENGDTSASVCGASSTPGQLTFDFQSASNADYLFVITNTDNEIFAILNGNSVSFNGVRIGDYRVWGVSYTGNVQARAGQNLFEIEISSECFDISDNFVSVRKEETTGGAIAAATGGTEFTFCPGNGKPDMVQLSTTGNSSGTYAFVLTNDNNAFISVLPGASIDFDTLPVGVYRIWGLAFTGNLIIQPGDDAALVEISDACYDLSDNFIRVATELPDGGTVSLVENEIRQFTCPGDDKADIIEFFNEGSSGQNFVFLITDENNIIEAITTENSYDFEAGTEGINRVWGLAYSGNLTAQVGDDAAATILSDDCYDLSDNFVEIIRETPVGGDVFLQNGDTITFVCVGEGVSTVLKFDSTGTSRGDYIYVITDENNIIRNGIFGDEFDFSFLPLGTYRVWGLAYTGTLTATIGDVVTEVPISDDCFDLSDTYASVVIGESDGGMVATNDGATSVSICVGDGETDVIAFDSTSIAAANYVYLITDKNNVVLAIAEGDSFDFENLDVDTCRVWGLSYSGDLLVQVGDNAGAVDLASGCAELSGNFILVDRSLVDGAMIASDRNADVIYTCVGDGVSDLIVFSNTSSATNAQYIYVLTNENNVIRGTVSGSQFDFETAGVGISRVWGVSYTGQFTGAFGVNLLTSNLATGCFNVSENFITISRDRPLGGDVSTEDGATSTLFCPSPSTPTLKFQTTSNRRTGYIFVVTDANNTIVAFSTDNEVNFEKLAVGTYRVWGLSYTGTLSLNIGDNILGTDPLATSCFEISANFVEVYRATLVDGGRIANLEGPDTLYVCRENESADLVVLGNDSEAADANYRYILTDSNNIILSRNLESDVVDFNGAMPGIYHIWGISYTGNFLALASDNASTAILSDSCYQLSENFIAIFVDTPRGGTVTTTDSLTFIEPVLDLAEPTLYSFRSANTSILKYQYVVTNNFDVIVAFIDSVDVNFEDLAFWGTLKIWGLAYTGNITAQIGDNLNQVALTDDCYDLSDNFVAVVFPVPATDGDAGVTARQQPSEPLEILTESTAPMELSIAPNPAVDRIRLNVVANNPESDEGTIRIYSQTGQLMHEERIQMATGGNETQIRISDLPDGLYLLQLRNGKQVQTIRFLKQWQ